ncbi:MAG: hypothetical protein MJZ70_00740 [Bacteroidales bacterium]|nr:hypothetical protein [Bacteroidales bacterium]
MKKPILFLLTISTLIIFNSCGKGYDYRNKWLGEYQCRVIQEYPRNYTDENQETWYIEKLDKDGINLVYHDPDGWWAENPFPIEIHAQVQKDGTLYNGNRKGFSGTFIKRDSLYMTYQYQASAQTIKKYYYCIKSKQK